MFVVDSAAHYFCLKIFAGIEDKEKNEISKNH